MTVTAKHAHNHILLACRLFYQMPLAQAVWQRICPNFHHYARQTPVVPLPAWLSLPDSHYLIAVALLINHFTSSPQKNLADILNGQIRHVSIVGEQGQVHSCLASASSDARNAWLTGLKDKRLSLVNISGFSAGSLLGLTIYRLLAEAGLAIKAKPADIVLGALAAPTLLFHDFYKYGRVPIPQLTSDGPCEHSSNSGLVVVHNVHDELTPFAPSDAQVLRLFGENGHKLVRIKAHPPSCGKHGHSYSQHLQAIAKLPPVVHHFHSIMMNLDLATTDDYLTLLMVDLALSMGTRRFCEVLKNLLRVDEAGTLLEVFDKADQHLSSQEKRILAEMQKLTSLIV